MPMLKVFCNDGQIMVQAGDVTIPPEPSGDVTNPLVPSKEGTIPQEPSGEGNSQPKSPIDVSDDEQDEALLKLNEDKL